MQHNVPFWGETLRLLVGFLAVFGGGTMRDLLLDHWPYAVCAFAGGWTYVGLWLLQAPGWLALLACVLVTAGLRGLALWRDWQLPGWRV